LRNISFSATIEQLKNGTKNVTRRVWKKQWVNRGDILCAVEKAQGLRKGEKIKRLEKIMVLEVSQEPLRRIIDEPNRSYHPLPPRREVSREGFPALTEEQFCEMFCRLNKKCTLDTIVTRIAFVKVE